MVPANFPKLLDSVYHGDNEAAADLYDRYKPLMLGIVRTHLNLAMRSQADSEDFVQEVWTAFVKDIPLHRSFETPEQLAAFLGRVARHKVIDGLRRCFQSQKANVNREVRLDQWEEMGGALRDDHSTPSETAIRNEMREAILSGLLPAHRVIGGLIFDGVSLPDISLKTGVSLRTIERVRDRIADKLR